MPFDAQAYRLVTQNLSCSQKLEYLNLLVTYWERAGDLPADLEIQWKQWLRIDAAGMHASQACIRPWRIDTKSGKLRHPIFDRKINKANKFSEKQSRISRRRWPQKDAPRIDPSGMHAGDGVRGEAKLLINRKIDTNQTHAESMRRRAKRLISERMRTIAPRIDPSGMHAGDGVRGEAKLLINRKIDTNQTHAESMRRRAKRLISERMRTIALMRWYKPLNWTDMHGVDNLLINKVIDTSQQHVNLMRVVAKQLINKGMQTTDPTGMHADIHNARAQKRAQKAFSESSNEVQKQKPSRAGGTPAPPRPFQNTPPVPVSPRIDGQHRILVRRAAFREAVLDVSEGREDESLGKQSTASVARARSGGNGHCRKASDPAFEDPRFDWGERLIRSAWHKFVCEAKIVECNSMFPEACINCPWNSWEKRELGKLFKACQGLNEKQLQACLENRFQSDAIVLTERPAQWIGKLMGYLAGPQTKYKTLKDLESERRYQPGVSSWTPKEVTARAQRLADEERQNFETWSGMSEAYRARNPWKGPFR
jgi:hypothetical protein